MRKVYVKVLAVFDENGTIRPHRITYDDGHTYIIDQVLDIRPAASLKVGGAGIRYRIRIGQAETYLFLEEQRWFVEGKA